MPILTTCMVLNNRRVLVKLQLNEAFLELNRLDLLYKYLPVRKFTYIFTFFLSIIRAR